MSSYHKAKYYAIVEAGKMLEKVCHATPDGAVYDDNFSDMTVAVATGVPQTTVATMRLEKYGKIRRPRQDNTALRESQHNTAQIEELMTRIANLETSLAQLQSHFRDALRKIDSFR